MAEVQLQHIGRGPLVRHQDMGSTLKKSSIQLWKKCKCYFVIQFEINLINSVNI